jgi:hypothetical protein
MQLDAGDDRWSYEASRFGARLRRAPIFRRPRLFCSILVLVALPVLTIITILVVKAQFGLFTGGMPPLTGPFYHEFPRLNGYYHGFNKLVPFKDWIPENNYREADESTQKLAADLRSTVPATPELIAYSPYPLYTSPEYVDEYEAVEQCFLDERDTVMPPHIFAYSGIPQGMTQPVFGSYEELGIHQDVCFERFGRLGPYGYGYDFAKGGLDLGELSDRNGTDAFWQAQPPVDWRGINLGLAQKRCAEKNQRRFIASEEGASKKKKISRTAMILRAWTGFDWDPRFMLNMRALVTELSLKSGGEYEVFILLHVKDESLPIWTSDEVYRKVLEENVPREFWDLTVLWNVPLMTLYYPGPFENNIANMNGGPLHGVYRSAHFAMQWFSQNHPEYDYIWNWEMDIRYSGHWYELLSQVGKWANGQPRKGLWERSSRFWIPELHGSHRNFSHLVNTELRENGKEPIWGPVRFEVDAHLDESFDEMPPHTWLEDNYTWGVGEEADLITFNPLFDPTITDWVFRDDITGYLLTLPPPPRRISIVTASRLSRRLLTTMHAEVFKFKHTAFAEMFPATVALHHGYKAAYAPHPLYFDRDPPLHWLDRVFNYPQTPQDSVFGSRGENNFGGISFYYNSGFSGALWRRWLGMKENGEGGATWEKEGSKKGKDGGEGRMCLRSTLHHPIKYENLPED